VISSEGCNKWRVVAEVVPNGKSVSRARVGDRGFVKALVEADSDRILGFTAFGIGAGEVMSAVQIAMIAGLPYTALRDAVLTYPTLVEGLIPLSSSVASASSSTGANAALKSGNRALPE
jgi:pyruvate/2-oxoglutarate dehydrogenase complex dihydrolipoamide dehydrogenase (E3) component